MTKSQKAKEMAVVRAAVNYVRVYESFISINDVVRKMRALKRACHALSKTRKRK